MRYIFFLIPFISLFSFQSIDRLEQLFELSQPIDNQTLVVFDVDEVLIYAKPESIRELYVGSKEVYSVINQVAQNKGGLAGSFSAVDLESMIYAKSTRHLVEKGVSRLIERLKTNSHVIALTNFYTGEFGVIPSIENWRYNELKGYGIEFEDVGLIEFGNMSSLRGRNPVHDRGIIYCDYVNKGDLLLEYYKQLPYPINHVIFIDDKPNNCLAVEKAFDGVVDTVEVYNYLGGIKEKAPFDPELAKLQLTTLMLRGSWLEDAEAKEMLGR